MPGGLPAARTLTKYHMPEAIQGPECRRRDPYNYEAPDYETKDCRISR